MVGFNKIAAPSATVEAVYLQWRWTLVRSLESSLFQILTKHHNSRYTDRLECVAHQFNQALSIDPLLWAAYVELCKLGAAGEATTVFGDSAFECIQKQYMTHDAGLQLQASSDDQNVVSGRQQVVQNVNVRQSRHLNGNNSKDNSLNHSGAVFSGSTAASQPNNGGHANISFYNTPSPMATQAATKAIGRLQAAAKAAVLYFSDADGRS